MISYSSSTGHFALVLLVVLVAGCGCGALSPDAEVVAEVLGRRITREDIESGLTSEQGQRIRASAPSPDTYAEWAEMEPTRALRRHIWRPLLDHYIREHSLRAEDEEIRSYQRTHHDPKDHHGVPRGTATRAIEWWKLEHALYNEFGGRVYRDDMGKLEPVDAFFAYYRACEDEGLFTIHDPELRERFYDYSWDLARYEEVLSGADAVRSMKQPIWEAAR